MKRNNLMICVSLAGTMLAMSAFALPAYCEETDSPAADLTVGLYSKYIWRGYELSKDSLVIQPSVTVGYKGFAFNLWGNLDSDQSNEIYANESNKWNETDMTLSYDGSYGKAGYSVGYIYYALDGAEDTQELYTGISLDVLTSPTLTIYRDIATFPGWYITLDVSHSLGLTDALALNLGAKISYLSADDTSTLADPNDPTSSYSDFHDGVLSLSLSYTPMEYLTISPELYYSFALGSDAQDVLEAASASGDDADFIYGGVSLSSAF